VPFLVSDTSVLIDLRRGNLLEFAFRLRDTFAVPDLLFERELKPDGGAQLQELGLRVESLSPEMVIAATRLKSDYSLLSIPDCFALALAEANGWTLLTGDSLLRELADRRQLDCHGVLWVLDRMQIERVASLTALHAGLTAIAAHPRCRLPPREIAQRLAAYA
jgi:predicted nucleic acid-binding protein